MGGFLFRFLMAFNALLVMANLVVFAVGDARWLNVVSIGVSLLGIAGLRAAEASV